MQLRDRRLVQSAGESGQDAEEQGQESLLPSPAGQAERNAGSVALFIIY